MEKYKPTILENGNYAEVLIEIKKCKICGALMIKDLGHYSIFPKYFKINQEAQMKEAGFTRFEEVLEEFRVKFDDKWLATPTLKE